MNKKAIAGILARLDDPELIETVLDLMKDKADDTPAANETSGQLFSIGQDNVRKRQKSNAPRAGRIWTESEHERMMQMLEWGFDKGEIAARLGRPRKAIDDRLYRVRKGEIAS